jgi:hypothetical protein
MRRMAVLAAVLVSALGATDALADDRTLLEAAQSKDARFEALYKRTTKAFDGWRRSGHSPRWARRMYRLHRLTRGEIELLKDLVAAEQPSTPDGETFKRLILLSLDEFDASLAWETRAIRARTAGRVARSKRLYRKTARLSRRSVRHEREAFEAIRRVIPEAAPTATAADDRSLREAGRSRDPQFARLGRRTRRAFRAWADSGYGASRAVRIYRLHRRTRKELRIVVEAVTAEQPSSPDGETYKRLLLLSLDDFDASLRWEVRAVRARTAGQVRRFERLIVKATRLFRRSVRRERRALRAIRRVVPD